MIEQDHSTEKRLNEELERLKRFSGLGSELSVIWKPRSDSVLSGEVKKDIICIYELEEEKAISILRHEFIDFCVSQPIDPYKEITNSLIRVLNDIAYKRKEKVVEGLNRIIDQNQ